MKVLIRLLPPGLLLLLALAPLTVLAPYARGQASCLDAGDEPHHSLIYRNNRVRIQELVLPRLKSTDVHCHQYTYLSVVTTESRTTDGPWGNDWTPGEARLIYAPATHNIRNDESITHRAIEVEVLGTLPAYRFQPNPNRDPLGSDLGTLKPTWTTTFTWGPLTATRTQLAGGDSWDVNQPDHLLIAITSLELEKQGPGGTSEKISLERGETLILPGGSVSKLTNKGGDGAKFVVVEF